MTHNTEPDKVNGWDICQVNWKYQFDGKWFATRLIDDKWSDWSLQYVEQHVYLHADGEARLSLKNGDEWSGYFDSKEDLVAVAQSSVESGCCVMPHKALREFRELITERKQSYANLAADSTLSEFTREGAKDIASELRRVLVEFQAMVQRFAKPLTQPEATGSNRNPGLTHRK